MRGPRAGGGGVGANTGPFRVFLGPLNWANKACHYAFPTREAAQVFADAHQGRDPHRAIVVQDCAGVQNWTPDPTNEGDSNG